MPETQRDSREEPVRVGLLGCSDIARRKFLPALCASERAVLKAVASSTQEKAATFARGTTGAVCTYEELLARSDVELIYLSLPNHLHEPWTLRALASGKHVLCEKPLGLTTASVERMLTTAATGNRLLCENLMFLHHPQHAAVREIVASGRLGRLLGLSSVFAIPMPAPGNYRLDPARGGGAFYDLARYPLGIACYFLEGVLESFRGYAGDHNGLNLAMHGVARSSTGEFMNFSIAFGQSYESYYELIGDRGRIRVDRAFTAPADLANRVAVTVDGADASFTVPAADHFRLLLDHTCTLIRDGNDYRQPAELSRQLAFYAEQMTQGCRYEG